MIESSDEPTVRFENAKELYKYYLSKADSLASDGVVLEDGQLKVTFRGGATLKSDNVLRFSCNR